jgi:hypothetical protein
MLKGFVGDDQGQDILEYMVLLGFIVAASVAFYIEAGGSATVRWIAAHVKP